jgi:hypothetical protein
MGFVPVTRVQDESHEFLFWRSKCERLDKLKNRQNLLCNRLQQSFIIENESNSQVYCFIELRFYNLARDISEPASSVSVVSGYGLAYRAIEVRTSIEAKGFFL